MSSLILQRFSEYLENPKVLTHPQEFLGLHYKKVLEFWKKIENLTQEQLDIVNRIYWTFFDENFSEWRKAVDLANEAFKKVDGYNYDIEAFWAVEDVTNSMAAVWATREILGELKNPVFLLMFDNL